MRGESKSASTETGAPEGEWRSQRSVRLGGIR
jgi:hypothetical protein